MVGQNRLLLHWRAHWQMLRYAQELNEAAEVQGQRRLLLMTLFGHLVRRLPQGNTGRAHIPAFRTMVPSAAVRERITQAMQAVAPPIQAA